MKTFLEVKDGNAYLTFIGTDAVEITEEQAQFALQNDKSITEAEILAMERIVILPTLDELKADAIGQAYQAAAALAAIGYNPPNTAYFLDMSEHAQGEFTKGLSLVNLAVQMGQLTETSEVVGVFSDISGVPIAPTVTELRYALLGYGFAVAQQRAILTAKIADINACTTAEELEAL